MRKACVLAHPFVIDAAMAAGANLIERAYFGDGSFMAWFEGDLVASGSQLQQIVIEGDSVWFKADLDT
jgi:hypothetical protein